MRKAAVIVQGFDRPNIWLGVNRFEDEDEKQESLVNQVVQADKPGIVYAATRKRTEELAQRLEERGVRAGFYHAGMKAADRKQAESAFMDDEMDVLVATTAFGMGVDKPNVHFVFHADISDSLDSYYQEIGRAGRDDEPAKAMLFYNPNDLHLRRFFSSGGKVESDDIKQVMAVLEQQKGPIAPKDLQEHIDLSKSKLRSALNHLSEIGVIKTSPIGEVTPATVPAEMGMWQRQRFKFKSASSSLSDRGWK